MKIKSIVLSFMLCVTMTSCVVLLPDDTDKSKSSRPVPQPEVPKRGYPAPELSPLVEEIVQELNTVRANPAWYAYTVLQPRLKYFDGVYYREPGRTVLVTREGAYAVRECIRALMSTAPTNRLKAETGLCYSAQWLANDQARTGRIGHDGSDGSIPVERMGRYGQLDGAAAENCAYGRKSAREIVVQLLVDDGVSERGHRMNIMRTDFRKVGIGFSDRGNAPYGAVCIMDFASAYTTR
ncbi:MAG: CAP domain-containing protein [Treponema sp.]